MKKLKNVIPSKKNPVMIIILDTWGNRITTLVDEEQRPGDCEIEFNTNGFTSGVYYCQMTAGNFSETKTMIIN